MVRERGAKVWVGSSGSATPIPFARARAFGRGIPGVHVRPERVTLVGHEFGGKVVGEVAVEVERALAREAEGGHGGERSGGGAHVEDGGARVGDHGRGGRGRIGGVVLPADVVAERAGIREGVSIVRGRPGAARGPPPRTRR